MAKRLKSNNKPLKDVTVILTGLAAVYVFASLALDTASMWMYLFTFTALWIVIRFTAKLIRTLLNGGYKAGKA